MMISSIIIITTNKNIILTYYEINIKIQLVKINKILRTKKDIPCKS